MAPAKPLPLTVTVVPPAAGPLDGETPATTGTGMMNLKVSALVAGVVPAAVVTEMATVPAACSGDVATSWVADFTEKDAAVVVPNLTCVTVENPAPVMVTWVPPAVDPLGGEMEVRSGRR